METLTRVFNDTEIRIVQKNGEPWLVAKDVCKALDISNPSMALKRLDDDETTLNTIEGKPNAAKQRFREVNVINEAGTYRLIFTSRKDEAKAFKRWLAHDVLPEIRRTGQYNGTSDMTPIQALAQTTQHMAAMERKQQEMDSRLTRMEKVRERANRQMSMLPPATEDAPEKSPRAALNEIVRAYAKATGLTYPTVWGKLYKEINYRLGLNVDTRARNRGCSKIEILDRNGLLEKAYAVAQSVFSDELGPRYAA